MTKLLGFTARASTAILDAESVVIYVCRLWKGKRDLVAAGIANLRCIEEADWQ